jgi:predicted transcriptional regulator
MTRALDDVWGSRDFPVLCAVVQLIDAGDQPATTRQISEVSGLDAATVNRSLSALSRTGYVTCHYKNSGVSSVTGVAAKAYEATGLHPDPTEVAESLVRLLEAAARQSTDPEERSKLLAIAAAAGNVGGQILGNVISSLLTRMAGLS